MNPTETDTSQNPESDPAALNAGRQAALTHLARVMGHDFNNLLQGVMGAISVVKLSTPPSHQLYSILELAERSAGQARELGRRLIFLAKGPTELSHSGSLDPLLRTSVEAGLRGTAIRAQFDLGPGLLVKFDEPALRILLDCLVNNAREAMPEGGTLTVTARPCALEGGPGRPAGAYVRYSFRDTGAGIAPEVLPRIFEPGFTTKTGRLPNGAGLSLAICEAIAWAHGGSLGAESSPGQGATMNLLLPAHQE